MAHKISCKFHETIRNERKILSGTISRPAPIINHVCTHNETRISLSTKECNSDAPYCVYEKN
ncbi:hypothetical protein BMS3Abin06_02120 [bacterium BMS3Abin06]|nr:hypothetical protein BMS3Abin06_02120 [bacterium BMS3Abin06]